MSNLKLTTVYVPTSVEETPEKEGLYMVTNGVGFFEVQYDKDYSFHEEFTDCSGVTEWLKPIENVFVLTKEELEKLLGDAFDAGVNTTSSGVWDSPNKEQYINSLSIE